VCCELQTKSLLSENVFTKRFAQRGWFGAIPTALQTFNCLHWNFVCFTGAVEWITALGFESVHWLIVLFVFEIHIISPIYHFFHGFAGLLDCRQGTLQFCSNPFFTMTLHFHRICSLFCGYHSRCSSFLWTAVGTSVTSERLRQHYVVFHPVERKVAGVFSDRFSLFDNNLSVLHCRQLLEVTKAVFY